MYNSPLQYCPICKQHVALDQSKDECAAQNKCKTDACPLAHLFIKPSARAAKARKSSKVQRS